VFSRQYRAALLDYLLGSGESGLERAYELGRRAIGSSLGLLQILRVHQQALSAILESTSRPEEGLRRLKASQAFLMEALSPFDMACRGYSDMVGAPARHREPGRRAAAAH
jgi:sigma-B regulation protein RsbU (phosphoserine phosphatase)